MCGGEAGGEAPAKALSGKLVDPDSHRSPAYRGTFFEESHMPLINITYMGPVTGDRQTGNFPVVNWPQFTHILWWTSDRRVRLKIEFVTRTNTRQ